MTHGRKSIILVLLILITGVSGLQAQYSEEDPYDRRGKLFLIPEFWLSFGSSTYIEVTPLVGYHVNDRLVVGAGPHYIFQSWRSTPQIPGYETHVFGMKAFSRFALITHAENFLPIQLFNDLFVHVEYEGMSLENGAYGQVGEDPRYFWNVFLVGGGFNQRIGQYNSVSFMVLWDLNESYSSPYSNPVFRIGFNTYL